MNKHTQLLETIDAIASIEQTIKSLNDYKHTRHIFIYNNTRSFIGSIRDEVKANEAEMNDCIEKISMLNKEVFGLRHSITIDSILEHQEQIKAAKINAEQLDSVIFEQLQIIIKAVVPSDPTSQLITQREELLAQIALGSDRSSELKKLDAQIEKTSANHASIVANHQKTIDHAQQTINGLEKRLSNEQQRIDYLENYSAKILDAFLMAKATQTASEFNQLANVLYEKTNELIALESFIATLGKRRNTELFYQKWELKIPYVDHDKPAQIDSAYKIYSFLEHGSERIHENTAEGVASLKQRLADHGVTITLS